MSPSSLFFGILFIVIGVLTARFIIQAMRAERESLSADHYASYPTATGTVLDLLSSKNHWFVGFVNAEGEECLGMDDRFAESVFHPERYHMPKRGAQVKLYYWPFEEAYDRNTAYTVNGLRAHYWIHFCDESLYEVSHAKTKQRLWGYLLLCAAFLAAGVLTLLYGH